MTATVPLVRLPPSSHTNGHKPARRPVAVTLQRSRLVESLLDLQCLTVEAGGLGGAALQIARMESATPELLRVLVDQRQYHVRLLDGLKAIAGEIDGVGDMEAVES